MENDVKMVPALCTQCGGKVEVDANAKTATCPYCGMSFMIEKAVNNYNVKYATIEHADTVNIDARGAVKDVLDFVGEQLKEGREERRELRKEANTPFNGASPIKILAGMFAILIPAAVILFLLVNLTDKFTGNNDAQAVSEEGSTIGCTVRNGALYVDVLGADIPDYVFQPYESTGTVLNDEYTDSEGYHCSIYAEKYLDEGIRYAVIAAFEDESTSEYADPLFYAVVKVTIENYEITEADEPMIVDSLSEYDFD